jgi:RND family efflux transporter MFP subunit
LLASADEVTVMTLKRSVFHHELISNGVLSAQRYADLKFESSETVAEIHVKNGARVSKGQTLASLSTFRLKNKTAQALDALEKAKLEMQDLLIGQGYAADDSTKAPPALMQLIRTKSGYNQAIEQYSLAVYEEEHAVLRAPFDGIVANLFAKQYQTASPSDVFCTVIDPRTLEASFSVLENELPLIHAGDKVVVTPFAIAEGRTEGRIIEINPVVDKDGMIKVKALVTYNSMLYEGMKVRVAILRDVANQLVVPKSTVVIRSGKQVVFTLADNKAQWVYVQTGLENSDSYTIADESLKDGDVVITSGNVNLAHESPVSVRVMSDE